MDLGGTADDGGLSGDPFGDVPADPVTGSDAPPVEPGEPGSPTNPLDVSALPEEQRLGGVEAPVEDDPPTPISDEEMAAEVAAEAEAEPEPAPEPEPTPEPEPEPEPEPTPEPEPDPPAPDPAPTPSGTSESRTYIILEEQETGTWKEVAREEAHNGDGALRKGYRTLLAAEPAGTPPKDRNLLPIASTFWKPKKVAARPTTGMAIDIG